jgi:natural product precursor
MKKLTSIKSPLFNTLEEREMRNVMGGLVQPVNTGTAASPIMTAHKDGTSTTDGSNPANPDDGPNDANQ